MPHDLIIKILGADVIRAYESGRDLSGSSHARVQKLWRRWVMSGDLRRRQERNHCRQVKAARRRNRGRAPFARFR